MQTLEEPGGDLGSLIGEHKQGDTALWLFRGGLFVEHRRARFAGRFDDIRGVYLDDASQSAAFRLALPGRMSVRLQGNDQSAEATLRGLLNRATAALLTRCANEYERGETVDFGAVRLNKEAISVRRLIGWKRLPWSRLSGWMVRDGWLFLDAGEGRPSRFAEVRLRRIANLQALLALLRKRGGEADLHQPANALRHAARGRTLFSRSSTALHRRPETAARIAGRWTLYVAAAAVGGYLGVHYDLDAKLLAQLDAFRWLWQHLH